jgi:hypothetical protein
VKVFRRLRGPCCLRRNEEASVAHIRHKASDTQAHVQRYFTCFPLNSPPSKLNLLPLPFPGNPASLRAQHPTRILVFSVWLWREFLSYPFFRVVSVLCPLLTLFCCKLALYRYFFDSISIAVLRFPSRFSPCMVHWDKLLCQ